jgi:23S rRNA (cytosine1962-C5)-methyltransferase
MPPGARSAASAATPERLGLALQRRSSLLADPSITALRVLNGAADGIDGLVIEKLGDVLVAQVHEGRIAVDEAAVRELCSAAMQRLRATAVYRKVFPKDRSTPRPDLEQQHSDPSPWIGRRVDAEFAVLERGIKLLVRPYDGYSTGIFLEHRDNRARVRGLASGRRVLNAFAYTCGFSVAAALGGAAATVSVDLSVKSLEWGRRNFATNGQALDGHFFIASDVFDYYRRAARQGRTFDLVTLDPPSFSRTRRPRRAFAIVEDLDRLIDGVLPLLVPGGYLLLCSNHRRLSRRALENAVTHAAERARRRAALVEAPPLPGDFAGDPDFAKSVLFRAT